MIKFIALFTFSVLAISGAFFGVSQTMNIFIGITFALLVFFILVHAGLEKASSENWKVAETTVGLCNSKWLILYILVALVCAAAAGAWWSFATWIVMSILILSLSERAVKITKMAERSEDDKPDTTGH